MQDPKIINPDPQEQVQESLQQQEQPQTQEESQKDYLDIVFHSVLGFLLAIAIFVGIIMALYYAYHGVKNGYSRWFGSDGLEEIGESGYYSYCSKDNCIVTSAVPHRRVLEGIFFLRGANEDSIDVARVTDGYRYINLNTAEFINGLRFDHAYSFRNGMAMATIGDTLFHLAPSGEIVSKEPANWLYSSIDEIRYSCPTEDSDGYPFEMTKPTGLYRYEDLNERYGIMNEEFVRVTPPVFTDITAQSKDVFFCELDYSGGVLVDKSGNIIK